MKLGKQMSALCRRVLLLSVALGCMQREMLVTVIISWKLWLLVLVQIVLLKLCVLLLLTAISGSVWRLICFPTLVLAMAGDIVLVLVSMVVGYLRGRLRPLTVMCMASEVDSPLLSIVMMCLSGGWL